MPKVLRFGLIKLSKKIEACNAAHIIKMCALQEQLATISKINMDAPLGLII